MCLCAVCLAASGCATMRLDSARQSFYSGRLDQADKALADLSQDETDRVLALMERGMIRHVLGKWEESARDWQEAIDLSEKLDFVSLSRQSASMIANDRLLAYRGYPFERILLHAFAAKNYLARAMWDDAAVEARHIAALTEDLYGFPDDPYSRYVAGVCFELAGDSEGAAFQYRSVSKLVPDLRIDERTGRFGSDADASNDRSPGHAELVCLAGIGRSGAQAPAFSSAPFAEVYAGNVYLGRTRAISRTSRLLDDSEKRLAALRAAKEASRIVIKDAIADAVSRKNDLLGQILRLILFALEQPDTRRWETLPEWLEVGRFPCPPGLKSCRVVFKSADGRVLGEKNVTSPIQWRDETGITFFRDL